MSITKEYKSRKAIHGMRESSDQMTQWELALQMVDAIPSHLFNTQALVPGSGLGTFALALVYRGWSPDKIVCIELDAGFALITQKRSPDITTIHTDYLTWEPNMQFDVIIGNPPYQNSQSGSRKGSSSNPLWWQFVKHSFELLKPDGYISFITPSVVVNGGRQFTKFFLGKTAKYDLTSIDFSADDYFNVGIEICRWSAVKRDPIGKTLIDGDRIVDARLETYIPSDSRLQSILQKLQSLNCPKLTFNQSKRYDYNVIERQLAESNKPIEWAKDLQSERSNTHVYAVANNDKIKYSRIKPPNYGVWRVFVPQFVSKAGLKFWIDDKMGATGTTWTHVCSSKEEANLIMSYVSSPVYVALINALKVNSRITGLIRTLPAIDITTILTKTEINYILSL